MPRKKEVDSAKLLKAIQAGKPSTEIMKEFGLKTSGQLKAAYLDALIETGQTPALVSKRGKKTAEQDSRKIKVNKRGSIVVTAELVEKMGFAIGDGFTVSKKKSGVSLKKN